MSSVEEQVLSLAAGLGLAGVSDVAPQSAASGLVFDPDQCFGQLATVEQFESIEESIGGGQVEDIFSVVSQSHVESRVSECDSRELFGDVSEFGSRSFEEPASDGSVFEQAGDIERGTGCPGGWLWCPDIAVVDDQFGCGDGIGGAAADGEPADFCDRRQCFAAEPQGVDSEQIFGGADF